MQGFDIPIVLFIFKRKDTLGPILERIAAVSPKKFYIMSDEGRDDAEKALVHSVREFVESKITWECEVVKDYAEENRGVYANIGLGALRVLSKEKCAIFLEDDNLPEVTFFNYCKEMLERYKEDSRVLWVCGTNYLGDYHTQNEASYMFTSHILPCGWATWADKFNKFYDKDLILFEDEYLRRQIATSFFDKRLYTQTLDKIKFEYLRKAKNIRYLSWDYHMMWSIRANGMLGISPAKNQIKNIGVDEFSAHGFHNKKDWASKRLCGMESYPLEFPIKHPKAVLIDIDYEKKTEAILLYPWKNRVYNHIRKFIIKLFGLEEDFRIKQWLKGCFIYEKR